MYDTRGRMGVASGGGGYLTSGGGAQGADWRVWTQWEIPEGDAPSSAGGGSAGGHLEVFRI